MIFEQSVYKLDVDVEQTRAFYEAEPGISCDCSGCRNFIEIAGALPEHIDAYLRQFGIDPGKPAEASAVYAPDADSIFYSGSYYICGTMLEGTDPWIPNGPKSYALREGYYISLGAGDDSVSFYEDDGWNPEWENQLFRLQIFFKASWVLDEENTYLL